MDFFVLYLCSCLCYFITYNPPDDVETIDDCNLSVVGKYLVSSDGKYVCLLFCLEDSNYA